MGPGQRVSSEAEVLQSSPLLSTLSQGHTVDHRTPHALDTTLQGGIGGIIAPILKLTKLGPVASILTVKGPDHGKTGPFQPDHWGSLWWCGCGSSPLLCERGPLPALGSSLSLDHLPIDSTWRRPVTKEGKQRCLGWGGRIWAEGPMPGTGTSHPSGLAWNPGL